MKKPNPRFALFALSAVGLTALAVAGCSNGWLDSDERLETPAALLFDAQKAYDAEQFSKAAGLYAKAVKKDPTNVQARVGQAFAHIGEAGLSLTGIMGRAIEQGIGKSDSPSPSEEGTTTAKSDIAKFSAIVGLDDAEKEKITSDAQATLDADRLREISFKFRKLHEAWKAICPVLPATAIDILKAEGAKVTELLDVAKCRDGIKKNNGAAIFAAMVGVLSQAASLYQLLDGDYNGSPDVIDNVTAQFKSINDRQARVNSAGTDLSIISAEVAGLATDTRTLVEEINKIDESEIIPLALANMEVLKSLLNSLEGIPENVKETINKTLDKLSEAKTKFDAYKAQIGGMGTSGSTEGKATEMKKKAEEAAAKADGMIAKQVDALTAGGRTPTTTELQQFESNKTNVCTNFGDLATNAGLPTDTQKPCGCEKENSAKNTCCATKAATLTGDAKTQSVTSCCKGAYGPEGDPTACIAAGTSLWLDAAFVMPVEKTTSPTPAPGETSMSEGFVDLFKLAWSSWRD